MNCDVVELGIPASGEASHEETDPIFDDLDDYDPRDLGELEDMLEADDDL